MNTDAMQRVVMRGEYERGRRSNFDTRFQECADFAAPYFNQFRTITSEGQKRRKTVNTVGIRCNNKFAIHVNSFLTGEGTSWFDLKTHDVLRNAGAMAQVRAWLDQVKRVGYSIFNDPGSGFATTLSQMYEQAGAFGNAPIYVEDRGGIPHYRSVFLGQCFAQFDRYGNVVGVYRFYPSSAWDLADAFGKDTLPSDVQKALEIEPGRMFPCLHAVRPREDGDPVDFFGRRYVEFYILLEPLHQLREPEFHYENPYLFPRWTVAAGETYGRGPTDFALEDIKSVNRIDASANRIIHKHADPGWTADDESGSQPRVAQEPGGITYARMNAAGHFTVQQNQPYGNPVQAMELLRYKEDRIRELYYLDAFELVQKITDKGAVNHMSATEFAGRAEQQFRMAGPPLTRLRAELLYPLIQRNFAILWRSGRLPQPPPQLRGLQIMVEYVSQLALAQQNQEGNAVLQTINDFLPLAQIDPRALYAVNIERSAQIVGRSRHAPQEMFNTAEEYQAILAQLEQQRQAQVNNEQLVATSQANLNNAKAMETAQGQA